jgi:hypothetical protein
MSYQEAAIITKYANVAKEPIGAFTPPNEGPEYARSKIVAKYLDFLTTPRRSYCQIFASQMIKVLDTQ